MLDAESPVPSDLTHPAFVATPLTTAYVDLDHAAYLASADVIRVHSDGRWPVDGFALDDDRRQVLVHQADHEARRAFTLLILDPTQAESLGCLYLNPLHARLASAGADQPVLERLLAWFGDGDLLAPTGPPVHKHA